MLKHRQKKKAKAMLFKFRRDVSRFLRQQSKKSGKTMTRLIEELLAERMAMKGDL